MFTFIVACQTCSKALAWVHNFFISTTVQRVSNEAQQTDFLSSFLFFFPQSLLLTNCLDFLLS